ncbi:PepSY domain-containing protein [Micromonospora sp. NBC_01813]|uniref:PepSY domain-containing protein n=1 Tax=Micromonospora sp. NBC_01813 TaxID=2975988 RepID=UPI002DDB6F51|nr:PepSY domain-containing protein [Micromonospora sp. NBC_01813]WSA09714.1 PepSY domain-containing protein [Micromonospora sp. NBC_01813]
MARKSVIVMAGVGAVAALAVAGTALGAAAQQTTGAATPASPVDATVAQASATSTAGTGTAGTGAAGRQDGTTTTDPIDVEQAKRIALDHVGGGRVTEIERDHEDGRPVWEVEIRAGAVEWDLDIDRTTGDILDVDRDDDSDDRDDDDRDDRDDDDRDDRDDDDRYDD